MVILQKILQNKKVIVPLPVTPQDNVNVKHIKLYNSLSKLNSHNPIVHLIEIVSIP